MVSPEFKEKLEGIAIEFPEFESRITQALMKAGSELTELEQGQ